MSAEEYWHGDVMYPRAYRKAAQIKRNDRNCEMWLQGMYFYEALGDMAPILQAFAKKGTKAREYPKKPFDIFPEKQKTPKQKKTEEEIAMENTKAHMEAMVAALNRSFAAKEAKKQNKS